MPGIFRLLLVAGAFVPMCLIVPQSVADLGRAEERVVGVHDVGQTWAGHSVGMCLLTAGDDQYVGYYNAERQMTVAHRRLPDDEWTYVQLPTHVGWDSHNDIELAVSEDGHLHVSGNMHVNPMIYFRTRVPGQIDSLEQQFPVVSETLEQRVTYPGFLGLPDGRLLFYFRNGASGSGDNVFYVYDVQLQRWATLLDRPLISGLGKMNAYPTFPPRLGPDGYFHLAWMWRDTKDAATNHDVCYARSRDLTTWETSDGQPLPLPITPGNAEVVDPVPAGAGLLNTSLALGFDPDGRVVVTYHKNAKDGTMQVYVARSTDSGWEIRQVSDWAGYRWTFGGGGSLENIEVKVGPIGTVDDELRMQVRRRDQTELWVLDTATLERTSHGPIRRLPDEVIRVEGEFKGLRKIVAVDRGASSRPGIRYVMSWETLGPNRDQPRVGPLPEPSMLRVYELAESKLPD